MYTNRLEVMSRCDAADETEDNVNPPAFFQVSIYQGLPKETDKTEVTKLLPNVVVESCLVCQICSYPAKNPICALCAISKLQISGKSFTDCKKRLKLAVKEKSRLAAEYERAWCKSRQASWFSINQQCAELEERLERYRLLRTWKKNTVQDLEKYFENLKWKKEHILHRNARIRQWLSEKSPLAIQSVLDTSSALKEKTRSISVGVNAERSKLIQSLLSFIFPLNIRNCDELLSEQRRHSEKIETTDDALAAALADATMTEFIGDRWVFSAQSPSSSGSGKLCLKLFDNHVMEGGGNYDILKTELLVTMPTTGEKGMAASASQTAYSEHMKAMSGLFATLSYLAQATTITSAVLDLPLPFHVDYDSFCLLRTTGRAGSASSLKNFSEAQLFDFAVIKLHANISYLALAIAGTPTQESSTWVTLADQPVDNLKYFFEKVLHRKFAKSSRSFQHCNSIILSEPLLKGLEEAIDKLPPGLRLISSSRRNIPGESTASSIGDEPSNPLRDQEWEKIHAEMINELPDEVYIVAPSHLGGSGIPRSGSLVNNLVSGVASFLKTMGGSVRM